MKPIDPREISALLDGELTEQRAAEVRRAIAEDDSLRQAYRQLAALDGDLKACAAEARFRPRVSTTEARGLPGGHVLSLAGLAFKMLPVGLAEVLELGVLALVVGWVLKCLLRASEEDHWRLARNTAANSA